MKYDETSNEDSRQGFPALEEGQRNSTIFVIYLEVDHIGSKSKIFNKWFPKFPRLIAYANEVFPMQHCTTCQKIVHGASSPSYNARGC